MLKLSTKNHIDKVTSQLRKNAGCESAELIDLDAVLKSEKILISHTALDKISGLSFVENGQSFIVINENESFEPRKRFTIAHELGHLVLHHNSPVTVSENSGILLRDPNAIKGESDFEVEANYFAASLLMPKELIFSKIKEFGHHSVSEDQIDLLAKSFGVSVPAMTIRLASLGFL